MNVRRGILAFGAACVFACGGKIASESEPQEVDPVGQTPRTGTTATAGTGATSSPSHPPAGSGGATAGVPSGKGSCTPQGSSASSSGDEGHASCTSEADYACASGPASVSCNCAQDDGVWKLGTCTCGDTTFQIDCNQGCQPTKSQYQTFCNLPPPY